jgi:predicted dehydrogenase
MSSLNRRDFLSTSAASLASLSALTAAGAADNPNEKLVLAVMGVKGRGRGHLSGFSAFPDVEIAYVCDPDENVIPGALKSINARQQRQPKVEKDIRKVLEDRNVNAIAIAAPDHWHALATIWACQAGKHVYVEKPISHNIIEGRRMVEAARKYDRVVMVGTQRRSGPQYMSAAEFVRSGKLGKIPFVKTWIAGNRPSIGRFSDEAVPTGVDYNLWLGAAPERAFNKNRFHYNWHWHWAYGTGEIGNNGVHYLDVARMVVPGLDAPLRISSLGGINFYTDDRETPDTQVATFDFGKTTLTWEHRIWSKTGAEGVSSGLVVYGEKGTMVFSKEGWKVIDAPAGAEPAEGPSAGIETPHLRNFVEAVKDKKKCNADIEEGHKSTRLCHLGNIALRVGRTLNFDAKTETISGDPEANKLLGREYRQPFVVPEKV